MDSERPVQDLEFIGSHTSIRRAALGNAAAEELARAIGVAPESFVASVDDPVTEADHVFLIRHTLMNPWLRVRHDGRNYLDRYCDFLEAVIAKEAGSAR